MRITRRHVLATTVAAAAAGTAGVGATALRWWDRAPGEGLRVLSPDEHAFIQAMGEAWMPRGGIPALSAADAGVGDFLDQTLLAVNPLNQKLMKLLMQSLDDSTLPTHLSAYRKLGLKQRQIVLKGWLHSENHLLRSAVQGLFVLMSLGFTTHPEVAEVLRPSMRCWYGR
ncbi:MAG: hypothetical protein H6737_10985 [Alphaproteobacteria bacterium]|nr:hypothetical protein [Alphaproteobacteria bacterium]